MESKRSEYGVSKCNNWRQIADLQAERERQDKTFHHQDHAASRWLAILTEEVGEVAKEVVDAESVGRLRAEIVQVAAVAVAWLEALDRGPAAFDANIKDLP